MDANPIQRRQEDWPNLGHEPSGLYRGVLVRKSPCFLKILCSNHGNCSQFVLQFRITTEDWACDEKISELRLPPEKGELKRHKVFFALRNIPLRACAEQAQEIRLKIARNIRDVRGFRVFRHLRIIALMTIRYKPISGEPGNTEMSAQMHQIGRTQRSVYCNQVYVRRILQQEHNAFDVAVLEANP